MKAQIKDPMPKLTKTHSESDQRAKLGAHHLLHLFLNPLTAELNLLRVWTVMLSFCPTKENLTPANSLVSGAMVKLDHHHGNAPLSVSVKCFHKVLTAGKIQTGYRQRRP